MKVIRKPREWVETCDRCKGAGEVRRREHFALWTPDEYEHTTALDSKHGVPPNTYVCTASPGGEILDACREGVEIARIVKRPVAFECACYVLVQQHRPTTNEMLMALLCARCRQGVEIALRHPEPLEAVVAVGMCRPCHDKMAPIVASGRSPSPELLCAPCRERLDATMKRARGLVDRTRPSWAAPSRVEPSASGESALPSGTCEDLRHVCGKCGFRWPERSAYDELVFEGKRLREALAARDREIELLRAEVDRLGGALGKVADDPFAFREKEV